MDITTILSVAVVILAVTTIGLVLVVLRYREKMKEKESLLSIKEDSWDEERRTLKHDVTEARTTISQLQEVVREYEERIVVLVDDAPEEDTPYNRAMKLSNEIVPYITRDGDKVKMMVFNNKGVTKEKTVDIEER